MASFQHVLVSSDFSPASDPALDAACTLARDLGCRLTVLHVCEVAGFSTTGPIPFDLVTPMVADAETRLEAVLARLRPQCPTVRGVVKVGTAWEEILSAARELGADLVVLGTHGRRGLSHAILGSVAERVVRLSPIPVLTVRSGGGET